MGYTRYNEEPRNPVLASSGISTGSYTVKGFEDTWQAALTLTQVLYNGGSLRANRSAAMLQADARRVREIRTLFKHGVGAKNEVLRVQVDVSNAELARIQADNNEKS